MSASGQGSSRRRSYTVPANPISSSTCSALVGLGRPDTLALGAAIGTPAARIKALRSDCKDGLEKRLRVFCDPSAQVLEDLGQTSSAVRGLVALARDFGQRYQSMKERRRVLDFSDLEHKTLDLLVGKSRSGPTVAALEIGNRFREVYNRLDETIARETGVARDGDEKTYNYLERAARLLAGKANSVEGLNTKIHDLTAERDKLKKAIEENNLVEWSIEDEEDIEETETEDTDSLQQGQPKSAGRKADTRTLPELLIENRDVILERIGTRLKTHTTETDIARLYIALVEYRFMRPCPIKTFRNALQQQYTDLSIVHERGIQKAYRNLTTPFGGSKKLIKDIGEDHVAIEELKAYLSA